jgi:hypothetical protein
VPEGPFGQGNQREESLHKVEQSIVDKISEATGIEHGEIFIGGEVIA